jgi:SsrA-binding protein
MQGNEETYHPQEAKTGILMSKKEKEKVIGKNRKARHNYEILDTLECGICLHGSEVKSLRDGKVSLNESFARLENEEVVLINCDIPQYKNAYMGMNHEPKRQRKLLLHKREIAKFAMKSQEKGLSLIPLKMYFKDGIVKVLLGIGKGRQLHDKREKMKKDDMKRDMER